MKNRDPYRLVKYVAVGAIDGVLAGWIFCAGLLALDAYELRSMASNSESGPLLTLIFFLLTGITFGMVGIAWRVMILLPDEDN
ncbi:hypothetical protein KHP62_01985 [Rhodobacteraceae bacterium NNCM2]|nr:hypothetical protein [Coraliihabitans acroporae]